MRVTIMGRPGAGKGTQASAVADRAGVEVVSISAMLKDRSGADDEIGRLIGEQMRRGVLVDDAYVSQALAGRLAMRDVKDGFLLDGYPRRADQGATLATMLAALPTPAALDCAIHLSLPRESARQRLASRLVCGVCGAPTSNELAGRDRRCADPACQGMVGRRQDDAEDVLDSRLDTFEEETVPLLDYYRENGLLVEIDASVGPAAVRDAVIDALRERRLLS